MPLPPVFALATLALGLAFGLATPARADPGYYVVTTYPDGGLRSADLRYWTVKTRQRPEVIWPEAGFAYGVNDRWTTELFASWIGSSQMATRLASWNWQNEVLLTQGEWPLDVAVHLQAIDDVEAGRGVEFGPVLQTDFGRTQVNFNLFGYREESNGSWAPTELRYQWQLRHRAMRGLHLGAQGFGELGPWDRWLPGAQQSHRAGPALFGTLELGGRTALHLQAAMLYGRVYGRSARMFTMRTRLAF